MRIVVARCTVDYSGRLSAHLPEALRLRRRGGLQFAFNYGSEPLSLPFDPDADCVLGSRFLGRAENISAQRKLLLKAAAFFTWLTAGIRLTDAHNGYRLLTARAARTLRIRQNRMAHASEIVEQIGQHRLRWVEAPVTIRYTDYSVAKGQRSSAAVRIVVDLLVGRLRR